MPQFYLAIGSKPRKRDLQVAKLVGQRHILVPLGSAGAELVRGDSDLVVIGDSGAWPPARRDRITLAAYAREVRAWGESLAWAMSYDTIGDVEASARDDARLRALVGPAVRVVPVVAVGAAAAEALDVTLDELDDEEAAQARAIGLSDALGPIDHPALAIGGIAASRSSGHAINWLIRFIRDLERLAAFDPSVATIHLLGCGRAELALLSPLIESFDSSGPLRAAGFGYGNIQPNFSPRYELLPEKLRRSREARIAYFLCQLRDRVGLPWTPADPDALRDDAESDDAEVRYHQQLLID